MKVHEVLTGRCGRYFRVTHPKGSVPFPAIMSAAKARYQFLKAPDLERILSEGGTALFEHGRFNDYEIKRVIVGEGFIACDVHGTTDIADALLSDIENWVIDELGYKRKDDGIVAQVFGSELEFSMPEDLSAPLRSLLSFGSKVSQYVRGYGNDSSDFGLDRIGFAIDPGGMQLLKTIVFAIERRAGVPHKHNVWYGAAPLKTADHIQLLEELLTSA